MSSQLFRRRPIAPLAATLLFLPLLFLDWGRGLHSAVESEPTAIGDVVLNEILFNPDPAAEGSQDCDGDGAPGEETGDNGADEFVELLNRGTTVVDLGGYCLASQPAASAGNNDRWALPAGTTIGAGAYLSICGKTFSDGSGSGFSIEDAQGNEITGFNNGGEHVTLFEPNTLGDCGSGVASTVFEVAYPDGESNGQSYQRCPNGSGDLMYINPLGAHSAPTLNAENLCGAQAVALDLARAEREEGGVALYWSTVSEREWQGFHILRRQGQDEWHLRTTEMIPVSRPGSPAGASYRWLDEGVVSFDPLHYRIEGVDSAGVLSVLVELELPMGGAEWLWLPLLRP